jgi:hypothetical protein
MADLATYFDPTGRDDLIAGGVRMVPIGIAGRLTGD